MWNEITCSFPNYNVAAIKFCEWISNFIPKLTGHVFIRATDQKWPIASPGLSGVIFVMTTKKFCSPHGIMCSYACEIPWNFPCGYASRCNGWFYHHLSSDPIFWLFWISLSFLSLFIHEATLPFQGVTVWNILRHVLFMLVRTSKICNIKQ